MVVTGGYLVVIGLICLYGTHRYWLLWLFSRKMTPPARINVPPPGRFDQLPHVTVQLPMFNEQAVAERVIDAACALAYPADRLRIQVLDDSADESARIAEAACIRQRAAGVDIHYIHREDRLGYKAGALAAGLKETDSDFVAIFDSDFTPPADFLQQTVHYFKDDKVGMVQGEWAHLNRSESLLTECQAIFLDGHFVIEQTARFRNGRWFNFNGTAGIWRRSCIDDAGGWEHDTLTEDADLSYRAQLRGWNFVYLPEVTCPAELPPTVSAFLSQQHRWTKGLTQTALKLMPTIFRSEAPWPVKLEAWFHLTSPIIYVAMVLLMLLALPAFAVLPSVAGWPVLVGFALGAAMLTMGTFAAAAFYLASQRALGFRLWETLLYLPILMGIGIGLSVINTKGVFEAVLGLKSPFVRTPKFNTRRQSAVDPAAHAPWRVLPRGTVELVFAGIAITSFVMSFSHPFTLIGAPFLLLFACGYLSIGVPSFARDIATRRARKTPEPQDSGT